MGYNGCTKLNVLIMNKKILIPVIGVAVLAAALLIFLKFRGAESDTISGLVVPTAAADIYEESNRLEVTEGTVTVKRANGAQEKVTNETEVGVGDHIIVDADSRATLHWFDFSVSRLAPGTELLIDKADYNPENINETDIGFEVVSGEVWSKVQAIVDEDSEFLGHAGDVVAGVRGSVFNILVEDDEVKIHSIEHALTAGDRTYTSGEWGVFDKESGENQAWGDIPLDDWNSDWFKANVGNDQEDKQRLMKKMMTKMKALLGTAPGDLDFQAKVAEWDVFMQSDAPDKKKNELKAKIVALVRALDVLPDDGLYAAKEMLIEKLISWEMDAEKKDYMKKNRIERRLYNLYDWVKNNDLDPEQVRAYLVRFRAMIGEKNEFFANNPDLIRLVEKIIDALEEKLPGMASEMEFLRVIDKMNDEEKKPVIRSAPIRKAPATTEPREVIEEEAPFHRGESNV